MSFDFSALTFKPPEHADAEAEVEIPKLANEPVMFENALDMVKRMEYGKNYFAIVAGTFIFGDFIEALCYEKELAPEEVYITTLGMSQNNIDSMVNLLKFLGVKKLNLIVSHYFAGTERHGLMEYIKQEFAGLNADVAVLQSHCKIVLIFSKKGNCLICGSANLSSSNNVEQFMILYDPKTIEFCRRKLAGIMEKFTVYRGLEPVSTPENNKGNVGLKAYHALKEVE